MVSAMTYKMFLDDERFPADDDVWFIARTSQEAMDLIHCHGMPAYIAFDHDLGGDDTAMAFLHALADHAIDGGLRFDFAYHVHSQNPIGAANIRAYIESFRRTFP